MDITLKKIEGIATIAFDGGRMNVLFGEPWYVDGFWRFPITLESIKASIKYPMSIIFDYANDPRLLELLGNGLLEEKHWEISFSKGLERQTPMNARLRGWHMDSRAKMFTLEFLLPERPIWPPESITLPIADN